MKYVIFVLLIFVLVACQGAGDSKASLETGQDSLSYSVGIQMGQNLKLGRDEMNLDAFIQGIRDGMDDEENLMTDDLVRQKFVEFQQAMRTKFQENQQKLAEEGIAKGEAFLEENKNKEGVVTLPSGLQYKVIRPGSGPSPRATDQVVVHYRGKLLDGTQFDSSYDRGQPATFGVNQVIKGWTEALQLMNTGAQWELYIPSELAYGSRGAGQSIPPNSTLIFEVELQEIK
jgi:FKBP-type peptidyl-prolyl cis-trans isomerase FklB